MTLLALSALACDRPSSSDGGRSALSASDSALRATPGYVVDSIHPPAEALRRFRVGLDSVTTLSGPRTRDELVTRFMTAVGAGDRVALERLAITRAEYAFLLYADLAVSRPPYRQPPEVAWLLLSTGNLGAIDKLTRGVATRFELLDYDCPVAAELSGTVRLQRGCTIRTREAGVERLMKLFGTIVEHRGRWKLLSLEGDL
jgi:hypothetical protein